MVHNKIRVFEYFKNSLDDAFFGIDEILSNEHHPEHKNLQLDLGDLDSKIVENFPKLMRLEHLFREGENIYTKKCVFYLVETIQKGIAIERLKELKKNRKDGAPYNSENLSDLEIEENNLVSVKNLTIYSTSFKYKQYIYHIAPIIDGSNSSYWISETISSLARSRNLDFRIRLDPFIEIPIQEYSPTMYKMTIYGKPLDWERLRLLREDEHGRWMNEDFSKGNITDFVWKPDGDELHFTCEELPNAGENNYRGSRYFHAILDKNTGEVKHCDGAIRIYTDFELKYRLNYHVRNPEARKIGKRIKIFQLDENIDQDAFALLITNFMVWNHDVINYFNAK